MDVDGSVSRRVTRPSTSLFVCGVPRGGTSLLAHLLESTGVAGRPSEWFWRDDVERNSRAWGVTSWDDYLDRVLERATTPNGVLGTKAMWGYLGELLFRLRIRTREYEARDLAVLEAIFPRPRFVWITREDTVAQAVSWAKAIQSGRWASFQQATGEVEFSFDEIDWLHHEVRIHNGSWRRWFASQGVEPFRLTYEELCADEEGSILRVLAWLDLEPLAGAIIEPGPELRKQADAVDADWAARYRALVHE
jgi:trehalose 2-sulfotransferase